MSVERRRELGLLPPPAPARSRASSTRYVGEEWGRGRMKAHAYNPPSLSLPRKRGRGRCGAALRNTTSAQAALFLHERNFGFVLSLWLRLAISHSSWSGLSCKSGLPDLRNLNIRNSGGPSCGAIHVFLRRRPASKAWMPGTRPGMTTETLLSPAPELWVRFVSLALFCGEQTQLGKTKPIRKTGRRDPYASCAGVETHIHLSNSPGEIGRSPNSLLSSPRGVPVAQSAMGRPESGDPYPVSSRWHTAYGSRLCARIARRRRA
jgi:hypothetical protein